MVEEQKTVIEKVIHQGKNAKFFRGKSKLTQEEMAGVMNNTLQENKNTLFKHITYKVIKQQHISTWEQAETLPKEALELYSFVFEIATRWLTDHNFYDANGNNFHQEGENNNNFQTIEQVHFNVHNPIKDVKEMHQETVATLSNVYNDSLTTTKELYERTFEKYEKSFDNLGKTLVQILKLTDSIAEKLKQ